jgi:hypothetical protein
MKNIFKCKPDLDFRGYGCYGSSDWYYELLERETEHFLKIQQQGLIERCHHGKWMLSAHAEKLCEKEAKYLNTYRQARTEHCRNWLLDRLRDRPLNGFWVVTDFLEGIEKLICEKDFWAHWRERQKQSRPNPGHPDDVPY